jgi:hypothetical protein
MPVTAKEIERDLDEMVKGRLIDPEHRDTAKLLLYAINFGCRNTDELAAKVKLSRDHFVRPRAKRLRAAGIWDSKSGHVMFEYAKGTPEEMNFEFVMHVLVAEGLVTRTETTQVSPNM